MGKNTAYILQVRPRIPARLARLEELANNLWYSWDRPTRALFARLHPGLWKVTEQSPKAFLKRVDEQRLLDAAEDQVFIGNLNRVLAAYDTYHDNGLPVGGSDWLLKGDLVAYFCAEFGFHESFPIYSGGLGILAGDHCKAASDLRLPFIGVGLLYRQGYFHQTIDGEGNQIATNIDSNFDDLPIAPARRPDGSEAYTSVDLPGRKRKLNIKIWQARIGHITLYLLDTDVEGNSPHDRDITHRLYGGDKAMRIEQEIVLGIGGVRALQELGLKPTVWHINEGHAAFLCWSASARRSRTRSWISRPRSSASRPTPCLPPIRQCLPGMTISARAWCMNTSNTIIPGLDWATTNSWRWDETRTVPIST
jgi:starch phosphorylase